MWQKVELEGVVEKERTVYRDGPYILETARMGELPDKQPLWSAAITREYTVGDTEVWGVGTEQEMIVLCEKAARAIGVLPEVE